MARPVKKRKLIREARKSGTLRAKKRELREEGMSRREARKAAKEMIAMTSKPTKKTKTPIKKSAVKKDVITVKSKPRAKNISSSLATIGTPLSDTKSYLEDNYRVQATDQYRASEYQDRVRQNINSESTAREVGDKTYTRIDPTTGSLVVAKVKKPSKMAEHGGALAIMITPVETKNNKKMKAVKKAPGGAAMKNMPKYEKGGALKAVPSEAKGLSKLPKSVRNKMGYAKHGSKVKAMYGAKMKKK